MPQSPDLFSGLWGLNRIDQAAGRTLAERTERSFESIGSDASVWPVSPAQPLAARGASKTDRESVAYAPQPRNAAAIDAVFGHEGEDLSWTAPLTLNKVPLSRIDSIV